MYDTTWYNYKCFFWLWIVRVVFPELCTTYICTVPQTDVKHGLINWQIPTSSLEKEWFCWFTFSMSYIDVWYDLYQDCRSSLLKVLYQIIQVSNLSTFGFSPFKVTFRFWNRYVWIFVYCIHEYVFLFLISRYRYTWLAVLCTSHKCDFLFLWYG